MKKNHILTMLFLACPVALLNAMDKEEQKVAEQIKIAFTEVQPGENTDDLVPVLTEIYTNLAPGKEEYVQERVPKFLTIMTNLLDQGGHILKASCSQGENPGFVSYEVLTDDEGQEAITFHISPVKSQYIFPVYRQAVEYVRENHKNASKAYVACPPFLQLHESIKSVGFQEGPGYKRNPQFPKPDVELITYVMDLTRDSS